MPWYLTINKILGNWDTLLVVTPLQIMYLAMKNIIFYHNDITIYEYLRNSLSYGNARLTEESGFVICCWWTNTIIYQRLPVIVGRALTFSPNTKCLVDIFFKYKCQKNSPSSTVCSAGYFYWVTSLCCGNRCFTI